jgi:tRNA pseudouridine32 synthase/23S rRNA pseudouridine746 synthase
VFFSRLFKDNHITKRYGIEVLGNLSREKRRGKIELGLDGKPATTEFEFNSYDPEKNTSALDVVTRTGRLHQVRRHFTMIGYPITGDPKYGRVNKNIDGLKLAAVGLKFTCPISRQVRIFELKDFSAQLGKGP